MPRAKCPKCGGEAECSHDYFVDRRQSDSIFDLFSLRCSSCGHEDSSVVFAGHISSAGQLSNTRDNPCPFCQGEAPKIEEGEREKKEERGIEYPDEYPID